MKIYRVMGAWYRYSDEGMPFSMNKVEVGDTGVARSKPPSLNVADAHGAHLPRKAPEHGLPRPTRKRMTIRCALAAAQRINRLIDPQGHGEF